MLFDHLGEDVPYLGVFLLDHLLRRFDRRHKAALFELGLDEGLEQLECHLARNPALVEAQFGSDDDDRPT